ncbi:MAG: hypothetical protein ACKVZ0_12230 [Gemmatimonadales bacterium]
MNPRHRVSNSLIRSTRWLFVLALTLGAATSATAQRPPRQPLRDPVLTPGATLRNADMCRPVSFTGQPPFWYGANPRIGGAAVDWFSEPNTQYVVERANLLDPNAWTLLTSTCGGGAPVTSFQVPWEDGTMRSVLRLNDDAPGIVLGMRYRYRITAIQFDRAAGFVTIDYDAPIASFRKAASFTVAGHDVTVTTPVSYCVPPNQRCDPTWVEYAITGTSFPFTYSSRQTWVNNAAPLDEPGTFTFTIPGVPSGNYQLVVTLIYPPAFRALAGTLLMQVP